MKKVYWDKFEFEKQTFIFTVTDQGINFVASPNDQLSTIFNFYPQGKFQYEFRYDKNKTAKYVAEFEKYFSGEPMEFTLPVDISEMGTAFQKEVLMKLQTVKYGQTVTYTQLAEMIGNPKAVRAVAHAVAINPVLIVIGCHRVIRADQTIGQYRGGTALKKELLALEQTPPKKGLIQKLSLAKLKP